MQVGDLVKHTYSDEIWVITELCPDGEYVEVSGQWLVPKDQVEVICE